MPYLTPEDFGEGDNCRPLSIPATSEWLAIVSGALTELTKGYNWEAFGALTVEECTERMQEMIAAYYDDPCGSTCDIGEGLPPFRLNQEGHIEQLIDGEWLPPEGEYEIPAVPSRGESTPEDRRCLAAANAANVLEQVYESLTESFSEDRTLEEAVGFVIGILATKFFWVAPIAAGMALLALAAMEIVYLLVEFFTADLWDSDFTDALRCILYDCSIDTGSVVTFDYSCVQGKLQKTLLYADLSLAQIRLLIQISYLLNALGGVDALNAAGATTEIDEAECDECFTEWCYRWFGTLYTDDGWSYGSYAGSDLTTYDGNKVIGGNSPGSPYGIFLDMTHGTIDGNLTFIGVGIEWSRTAGSGENYAIIYINGVDVAHSPNFSGTNEMAFYWTGDRDDVTSIHILAGVETNPGWDGYLRITSLTMRGAGDNPISEDNCI